MTRSLWIDAGAGAAGDMLLAALLDAGADRERVAAVLAGLGEAGAEPVALQLEPVRRHGLRALHARVLAPASQVYRHLPDVLRVIGAAPVSEPARAFAGRVFGALAEAEAAVHGQPVEQVHFHEVGALDALADVLGCAVALDSLGILDSDARRSVSPVAVGAGRVRTAHGSLPVPVPATLELLRRAGAPTLGWPGNGTGTGELCTPTGAALLTTLAGSWGPLPALRVEATGHGAGTADPAGHANIVRVVLGTGADTAPAWVQAELITVEATVDDLDPRLWPGVLEALYSAGAMDTWLTPVLMRHGRPGHVVTALVPPDRLDAVYVALVRDTTTLGARIAAVQRRALPRDVVTVEIAGHPIGVKRGLLDGSAITLQPEFADVLAASQATGRPVAGLLAEARLRASGQDGQTT